MHSDGPVPADVLDSFGVAGAGIEPLSGGRTNRTMRVRAGRDLVLQQLRASPQTDLLGVMENLVRVTSHLEWKHRTDPAPTGGEGRETWWPQLVPASTGTPFLMTEGGDVWRAYLFRDGRIARSAQPMAILESAAGLFGRFSRQTLDLDGPELLETTRAFHDLEAVWAGFQSEVAAAEADPDRKPAVAQLRSELTMVEQLYDKIVTRSADDGLAEQRQRVVHNDTKISNALLHLETPRAIAVLDLDLVMMGPLWHDVGDLLRSAAWHTDRAGPSLDADTAAQLIGSFLGAAGETVDQAEIAALAVAGPRLALELGVRYLTDHLRVEPQLRVDGPDGHRRRGLANVKLATEMLTAYDALRSAVDGLIARR